MDYAIEIDNSGQASLVDAAGDDLFNNVYVSLEIAQGNWWLDTSFGLRKRRGLKNTAAVAQLLKQDIESALQWLLDAGRATSIEVTMSRDLAADRHRVKAHVVVTSPAGQQVSYDKFIRVV